MTKIIAGRLKGRNILTINDKSYRPSQAKFREALFSILNSGEIGANFDIHSAQVLDLYAGSGSLGFEALSRGATHITLVDNQKEHLMQAALTAKSMNESENVTCLKFDASMLPIATKKFDLIFIDPPYYKNLVRKTLHNLHNKNWLADGAVLAVEVEFNTDIAPDKNFELLLERRYGKSKLYIFKYKIILVQI